jgi:hypothetical protein
MADQQQSLLPIDFSESGMNFVINNDTQHEQLINPDYLISCIQTLAANTSQLVQIGLDDLGRPINAFVPHRDEMPSYIQFNDDARFYFRGTLGQGAYAMTAHIQDEDGNDFCLKIQEYTPENSILFLHEVMIHFILDNKFRNADGTNNYVPKLYRIAKHENHLYIVTEKLVQTFGTYIDSLPVANYAEHIQAYLADIGRKLKVLYERCEYNHGDLHASNAMMNAGGEYKLIDFGFSRLFLSDDLGYLGVNEFCTRSTSSRDLTFITKMLFERQVITKYPPPSINYSRLQSFLRIDLNAICDRPGHELNHMTDLEMVPWGRNIYLYSNEHNNTKCEFETFLTDLQAIVNGGQAALNEIIRRDRIIRQRHTEIIERRRQYQLYSAGALITLALGLGFIFLRDYVLADYLDQQFGPPGQQGGFKKRKLKSQTKNKKHKQNVRRRRTFKHRKV